MVPYYLRLYTGWWARVRFFIMELLPCTQPSTSPSGFHLVVGSRVVLKVQSFSEGRWRKNRVAEKEGTIYLLYIIMRWLFYTSLLVLRPGFSEEDYSGNEGPDRQSTLPNMPCTVTITLLRTTIEDHLTFQLTTKTISEYTDANGGPPIGTLTGANASSKNMWLHPDERDGEEWENGEQEIINLRLLVESRTM